MDIAEAESQIISILFHPRICRYVKRMVGECGTVMEQTGETLTHRRVKFAYTLPIGDAADATRCRTRVCSIAHARVDGAPPRESGPGTWP